MGRKQCCFHRPSNSHSVEYPEEPQKSPSFFAALALWRGAGRREVRLWRCTYAEAHVPSANITQGRAGTEADIPSVECMLEISGGGGVGIENSQMSVCIQLYRASQLRNKDGIVGISKQEGTSVFKLIWPSSHHRRTSRLASLALGGYEICFFSFLPCNERIRIPLELPPSESSSQPPPSLLHSQPRSISAL